jgi:zinc protease
MDSLKPSRTVLPNGLSIITTTRVHSQLAACTLFYRAGSLHEPEGKTGLAHLMEHMMFRGTPRFPHGAIDEVTGRFGGWNNAVTTADYAAYYFVVPESAWRTPLEMEADRMANCLLGSESFETERRVALEEHRMASDDPECALDEAVDNLAYTVHPYRNPVIGRRGSIEALAVDDLRAFHDEFYVPSNAALVVAGPRTHHEVVEVVEEFFGEIPAREVRMPVPRVEPEQLKERRARVRSDHSTPRLTLAYHVPAAVHADSAALELLVTVLAAGRSSVLYQRLVRDLKVATEVSATRLLQKDPGLFWIAASLHPGADLEEAESALLDLLRELAETGISERQMETAKRLIAADTMLARETVLGATSTLGLWESVASLTHGEEFEKSLFERDGDALTEVLIRYLRPERRTSGWLVTPE